MAAITKLSCPACGGQIELQDDNDRFICLYCGNKLQIEQKEGEVSAKPFVQAVKNMHNSVDRVASEMAIKRIRLEIDALLTQREPHFSEWNRLKTIHEKTPHFNQWKKGFLWSLFGSPFLFLFAVAIDQMPIGIIAVLIFFASIIGLIVNSANSRLRKNFEKGYDKMSQIMLPLEEQIENKKKELEKHRKIVES